MQDSDTSIRNQIIEAAKARFAHYGYFKTTIAEIAKDCDMSAGNIYRYFKGKLEIASDIAHAESIAQVEHLRPLVDCDFRSARQKLEEIMFNELRNTFHRLENNEKVVELVQHVMHEQPRFFVESLKRERRVLAIVIESGRLNGEFNVTNANKTAAILQSSTMKFRYPQLFTHQTLQDLEEELHNLLDLMFTGLMREDSGEAG